MSSLAHEAPLDLMRRCPEMVPLLASRLPGVVLPPYSQVRLHDPVMTEVNPTEYRADLMVTLHDALGKEVLGLIVEVQLAPDLGKHYTWPYYGIAQRAKLRCPVYVVVFTYDEAMVRWAQQPIVGIGAFDSVYKVMVVGPADVPWVETLEEAIR